MPMRVASSASASVAPAGACAAPPCTADLKTYQVKVEGDAVLVGVPA